MLSDFLVRLIDFRDWDAGTGSGVETESGGEVPEVLERVPPQCRIHHHGVDHRQHLRRAEHSEREQQVVQRLHCGVDGAGRDQPGDGDHHVDRVAAPAS